MLWRGSPLGSRGWGEGWETTSHLSDGLKQPLCPQLRKHPVLPADRRRLGGEILRLGHLPTKLWLPRGPAFQQGSKFSAEHSPGTRAAEVCSGKCHGKGAGPCLFVAPLPLSVALISPPPPPQPSYSHIPLPAVKFPVITPSRSNVCAHPLLGLSDFGLPGGVRGAAVTH